MVGTVVDLTTPTNTSRSHETMDLRTPTLVGQAKNADDLISDDLMDLTTPSSLVQAKTTNDESDFVLQDTDEELSNADGASNELVFRLRREDEDQLFGVHSDVTIPPAESVVTQSQVANKYGHAHLPPNEDANKADATSMEQHQVTTHVNEDLQNQATSVNVNSKYRLNVDKINPLELLEEPILTMETDHVKAGAIKESTSVLQSPEDESTVEDNANKVTAKCLESFNFQKAET